MPETFTSAALRSTPANDTPSIELTSSCSNSPKNRRVQQLVVAFAAGNVHDVMPFLTADTFWQLIGGPSFEGRDAVQARIVAQPKPSRVRVTHALSHGRVGAAELEIELTDRIVRCAELLQFHDANCTRLQSLSSYRIEVRHP
jgi:hypothetical protein